MFAAWDGKGREEGNIVAAQVTFQVTAAADSVALPQSVALELSKAEARAYTRPLPSST